MATLEEYKIEFNKAIRDYYHKHELLLLRTPLLISCLVLFIIDYGLDLSIVVYFGILILLFFIARRIFKRKFISKLFSKVDFCSQEDLIIYDNQLQISNLGYSFNYNIKGCQLYFMGPFLLISSPPEYSNRNLTTKTIIVKIESEELKTKLQNLIKLNSKKINQPRVLSIVFLTISILIVSLKISEIVLNNYIYDNKEEWNIARIVISYNNNQPINIAGVADRENLINTHDSIYHYPVEITNRVGFSSLVPRNHLYFSYRYEPFNIIRLRSSIGLPPKYLTSTNNLLSNYRFYKNEKSMVLLNGQYKIYCILK